MSAPSPSVLWALCVENNRVVSLRTTDRGATWDTHDVGPSINAAVERIAAASADDAWAVGPNGVILHTENGGASWGPQRSGTTYNLRGIAAPSRTAVWVTTNTSNAILKGTPD